MGTNFYYKIPLSKRRIKQLQDLITEEPDYHTLLEELEEVKATHCIHLGKRSAGWQFLWNLNKCRYYAENLKSIMHFLNTGGGHIENEYGETFSVDAFINDEIGKSLYKDEKHCDLAEYYNKHPKEMLCNPNNEEFTLEGLRFSRHTEFC